MIQSTTVSLSAHYQDGKPVPHEVFLGRLAGHSYEQCPSEDGWQSARIVLFHQTAAQNADAQDALLSLVAKQLTKAAEWLTSHSPEQFTYFAGAGLMVNLFVDIWIDQDQFDFLLPPEFLRACGERGLSITVSTNT